MLGRNHSRRSFLGGVATVGSAALLGGMFDGPPLSAAESVTSAAPFELTKIVGTPRERGRQYGKQFAAGIDEFLDRESRR